MIYNLSKFFSQLFCKHIWKIIDVETLCSMNMIGNLRKYTRDGIYRQIGSTTYAITKKCLKCNKEKIAEYEEADWEIIHSYNRF